MRGSREKALKIDVDRLMRTQHRKHFQQPHIDQVLPAEERCLKTRLHAPEFRAIFVEETAETWRVARRDRGDLLLHACDVRCRVQLAAFAEDDAVLRIEPHHFHLRAQRRAGGGENFLEHARVKEERRAEIELEAIRLDRRSASADGRESFDDLHFHSRSGEENGGSETAGTGADDNDIFFHDGERGRAEWLRISFSLRRREGAHQPRAASNARNADARARQLRPR